MSQGSTRGIPIDTDTTLSADSNLLVPSQKAVKTYVDGKTIVDATPTDGSSNAVSSNGVFDALALKQDKVTGVSDTEIGYLDGVTSAIQTQLDNKPNLVNVEQIIRSKNNSVFGSHTGDTAETVLFTIPISANEFAIGDWMTFMFDFNKIGTVGAVTVRVRAGTNGTTADNTIALLGPGATNIDFSLTRRRFQFLTGNLLSGFRNLTSALTDASFSPNKTSTSITPSSGWFLTITGTLLNSSDTVECVGYRIGKIKTF
jgi:hypothetical protein